MARMAKARRARTSSVTARGRRAARRWQRARELAIRLGRVGHMCDIDDHIQRAPGISSTYAT